MDTGGIGQEPHRARNRRVGAAHRSAHAARRAPLDRRARDLRRCARGREHVAVCAPVLGPARRRGDAMSERGILFGPRARAAVWIVIGISTIATVISVLWGS